MFPINDTFDAILIGGFLFGLLFTLGTVLMGFADIGGDADSGHDFGGDHGMDAHGHADAGHVFKLFNVSSILAFITWFSGITYLARNGFGWVLGIAVVLGLVFGLAGAWLISWFLYSFLRKNSPELDPRDWQNIGQIGTVTSAINPGGVGEIIMERHGTRHSVPARTRGDIGIIRGTDVVILEEERGVAIVRPFAELMAEHELMEQ